ncbi:hypothetical protein FEM48_Zijuj03G0073700 [Ziziphus jujuba var. spinosa]|uniref:Uncharacterized protein n=1 Tax=Ziziphus jujuba var. spinosa TaxID=714518 RepID=A0A978VNY2_ZIZJJ|nr:hypothetical protein FEM48_Zijuj03G0073700 [Ziziphus jujuba var. spinosa]
MGRYLRRMAAAADEVASRRPYRMVFMLSIKLSYFQGRRWVQDQISTEFQNVSSSAFLRKPNPPSPPLEGGSHGGGGGGVFWNGAIHWITVNSSLLYFNVEEEVVKELPLPIDVDRSERISWYFGSLRDHLHLIETFRQKPGFSNIGFPMDPQFDIYELIS